MVVPVPEVLSQIFGIRMAWMEMLQKKLAIVMAIQIDGAILRVEVHLPILFQAPRGEIGSEDADVPDRDRDVLSKESGKVRDQSPCHKRSPVSWPMRSRFATASVSMSAGMSATMRPPA
jgi:hypothetical protein